MRTKIPILIVEDNKIDAHITESILKNADKRIETQLCTNGATAIDYLIANEESPPAFIFLDINMPIMNGKQFLIKKASLQNIQDVPVIMLTSSGLDSERKECFNLGAVEYIEKPLSIEVLTKNEKLVSLLH